MANLQEKSVWETGIYQLETSDPVLAGPDGIDNLQGKQLANRTVFLKKQIDDLVSGALVAEYADRLKTPRNIAMTGDGNWSVTFDGSGNVTGALALASTGVAPGSYGIVTVDAKGRVTTGRQMTAADVPALDWSKVSSGKPTTLSGYGITDAASKVDLQALAPKKSPVFEDRITVPEGTVTAPGITFALDGVGDTGFWHIADGFIGVACNGQEAARFGPDGIQFAGVPETLNTPKKLATATQAAVSSGLIGFFAGPAAPVGWLRANGTAVSRSTYAALFAAIGTTYGAGDGSTTFNLPDLRGEFMRGWDDGARGVEVGRALGSNQSDTVGPHDHTIKRMPDGGPLAISSGIGGTGKAWAYETYVNPSTNPPFLTGANSGIGTETRPRNVALLACIKT
ncbi:phage tail protein [Chromobacterium phragmitis]|nr:phage tail protein [Chromobacterium phragmitis]